ncbi:hypothetical protein DAMNIGENAA_11810 [Desulforhabdus amnigena]|jgi:hypothetical protein|uniref:Uncharacterized protein n=2 Tax=Desulforhabdus amnigena TaxID=40218 RepID=A0A9W6D1W7_9BACT|nr:hypothetical protein DAMNIGENAA_11810 [Desulforhabdus amnigena]
MVEGMDRLEVLSLRKKGMSILVGEAVKSTPRHATSLTPSPEGTEPVTCHLRSKGIYAVGVAGNGIVVYVALHN